MISYTHPVTQKLFHLCTVTLSEGRLHTFLTQNLTSPSEISNRNFGLISDVEASDLLSPQIKIGPDLSGRPIHELVICGTVRDLRRGKIVFSFFADRVNRYRGSPECICERVLNEKTLAQSLKIKDIVALYVIIFLSVFLVTVRAEVLAVLCTIKVSCTLLQCMIRTAQVIGVTQKHQRVLQMTWTNLNLTPSHQHFNVHLQLVAESVTVNTEVVLNHNSYLLHCWWWWW